jgi:hypothetical protein
MAQTQTSFDQAINQLFDVTNVRRKIGTIAALLKVLWRSSSFEDDFSCNDASRLFDTAIGNLGDPALVEHLVNETAVLYKDVLTLEDAISKQTKATVIYRETLKDRLLSLMDSYEIHEFFASIEELIRTQVELRQVSPDKQNLEEMANYLEKAAIASERLSPEFSIH